MTSTTRRLAGAALALTLAGCGGGSSGTTPTTLPPTTTLAPCTQTVLFSVSFSLPATALGIATFTTTQTGRLDVFLDWTFADSEVAFFVTPANTCRTSAQASAGCTVILDGSQGGAKPRKASAANVSAGSYDLLVFNLATQKEALSAQGFLRSATCPAFSAVPPVDAHVQQLPHFTEIVGPE